MDQHSEIAASGGALPYSAADEDAVDTAARTRVDGDGHGNGNGNGHSAARAEDVIQRIKKDPGVFREVAALAPPGSARGVDSDTNAAVELVVSVDFPTRYGAFMLYGFLERSTGLEHTAVVKGEVRAAEHCPVRVHSECHTGDVWGSLRCDCREQLEFALRYLGAAERGAIVYMRQEGRGIGLLNKLKAYRLQDLGLDTVEANQALGYPAEARDYRVAARILDMLGIASVELMSNNPDKIKKLSGDGVRVTGRIPVVAAPTEHNRFYLATKKAKMGHLY